MEEQVLSEEELAVILDPQAEVLEFETEASEEPAESEEESEGLHVTGQTGSVRIYSVGCSTGASTSFSLPITAFYWSVRLGYYRADGGRIGLSSIIRYPRSYYAGSVLSGRFNGRLPAGLRDLRAFWWYGAPEDTPGPVYWNRVNQSC
jgi:hypothetical protein